MSPPASASARSGVPEPHERLAALARKRPLDATSFRAMMAILNDPSSQVDKVFVTPLCEAFAALVPLPTTPMDLLQTVLERLQCVMNVHSFISEDDTDESVTR